MASSTIVVATPQFGRYEQRADREIPVLRSHPVDLSRGADLSMDAARSLIRGS